jgi:hypothetical protein
MKKLSKYQQVKIALKLGAKQYKKDFPNDKPKIRQLINDDVDHYCKDLNLSDYQRDLLSNYACKLHPKN